LELGGDLPACIDRMRFLQHVLSVTNDLTDGSGIWHFVPLNARVWIERVWRIWFFFGFLGGVGKDGETLEPVQRSRALGDLFLSISGLMKASSLLHIHYPFRYSTQHHSTFIQQIWYGLNINSRTTINISIERLGKIVHSTLG
jgi:hypothetical protein